MSRFLARLRGGANQQCPYYGPWPGQNDCGGWVNYFSSGYPTVGERGNQAQNMQFDPEWNAICTSDQMDEIFANTYAYGLNGWNVAIAVEGIKGNITDKSMLCKIATNILTPPANTCQEADWTNNYMNTMNEDVQKTLNLWKSYCK